MIEDKNNFNDDFWEKDAELINTDLNDCLK